MIIHVMIMVDPLGHIPAMVTGSDIMVIVTVEAGDMKLRHWHWITDLPVGRYFLLRW